MMTSAHTHVELEREKEGERGVVVGEGGGVGQMSKCCLKFSYQRGALMGKQCAFLQCSAGRWPKLCHHLSTLHEDGDFVLKF